MRPRNSAARIRTRFSGSDWASLVSGAVHPVASLPKVPAATMPQYRFHGFFERIAFSIFGLASANLLLALRNSTQNGDVFAVGLLWSLCFQYV